jgi:hypothetical protein
MSQPLDDFINAVRMAESLDQERFLIATEQAHIRAYVRDGDPCLRPRIVSKLVFLDMLGENPTWGQMEAITLMTHDVFSYKRVGYIGAAVLLDETKENPEVEIDKVTTPGGITIKGLNELEANGFSSAIIKGIKASKR